MDTMMSADLQIRPMTAADAEACGRAAYAAHHDVAVRHGFAPEHPSPEFSIGMMNGKLKDPRACGWVAERHETVVGSIFLNDFAPTPVAAIGPLTVEPGNQGGVGQALMQVALQRAQERGIERVRLVQSPSHLRSLALYAKFGFAVREPLVMITGTPPMAAGAEVRAATEHDTDACNALCKRVHGFARAGELSRGIAQQTARVVEREGRVRGYASAIGFLGHAIGETPQDIAALIAGSPRGAGPGFFLPLRNAELLSWALANGLKALWPALLMSRGPYQEPQGSFLPSIAF